MIRSILVLALTIALSSPALAGTLPVWATPADQIAVVNVGTANGLTFATIRDSGMHGHNVYCVTHGAHIGKLTVVAISAQGITLSNGRTISNPNAPIQTTTLADSANAQSIDH